MKKFITLLLLVSLNAFADPPIAKKFSSVPPTNCFIQTKVEPENKAFISVNRIIGVMAHDNFDRRYVKIILGGGDSLYTFYPTKEERDTGLVMIMRLVQKCNSVVLP